MSSHWHRSLYRLLGGTTWVGKAIFFAVIISLYVAFQIYPQESAFQVVKGSPNPQLLSSFVLKYPDSYRIGQVDDLLWQAAAAPEGNCALSLYQRVLPYGKHAGEAKQRPVRQEPGCAPGAVSN